MIDSESGLAQQKRWTNRLSTVPSQPLSRPHAPQLRDLQSKERQSGQSKMPKHYGKGRGGNQNRRTDRFIEEATGHDDRGYYDHDNRLGGEERFTRIGSGNGRQNQRGGMGGRNQKREFKINNASGISRHRRGGMDVRRIATIIEEDVDMAGSSNQDSTQQRYTPYRAQNNRRHQERGRQGQGSTSSWSQIIVLHASRYEKDVVLKTLLNASQHAFIPIYYHMEGNNAVFYIEDRVAAESLRELNRKITMTDNFKLSLVVKASLPPNLPINEELKEKIKLVMGRRYDAATKTLNLSQFHLDEELCTSYYTPLSRDNVLQAVVRIIGDNIPDVQTIDMSANKLRNLDQLKPLVQVAFSLRALNLARNQLTRVHALDALKGLPIEEIVLHDNPVCNEFKERSSYISAIRRRFPKLMKLDGAELPPVIEFDVGVEDSVLPTNQPSFFVQDEGRRVAQTFLAKYLEIYDTDDRTPLLAAYHDSTVMSLTVSFAPGTSASVAGRLDAYLRHSRNLKRIDEPRRRFQLLHQGKADVIAFLSKLPATSHEWTSLVVDVPICSAHLVVMSVTGVFRERSEPGTPMRWFQRVLVLMPLAGGSYCIVNEQFHISSATAAQVSAFKAPAASAVAAAPAVATTAVPAAVVPAAVVPAAVAPAAAELVTTDPVIRQQMVQSFAEQSGMNAQFSQNCLEQNGWDFNMAAHVFSELQKAGKIPPEAFIK